jgi:hypothetical protein
MFQEILRMRKLCWELTSELLHDFLRALENLMFYLRAVISIHCLTQLKVAIKCRM